jgi:proteic killer suppression protein
LLKSYCSKRIKVDALTPPHGERGLRIEKKISTFFVEQEKNTTFATVSTNMEIKFDKKYLEELFETGKVTDKKYRFQPQIIQKYRKTVDILESIARVEDLFRYNGLRYEALHGDKEGLESVRVNDQYRIEFKTSKIVSETVVTICNIVELSHHYK